MFLRSSAARWRLLLVSMLVAAGAVVGPTASLAATDFSAPNNYSFGDQQVAPGVSASATIYVSVPGSSLVIFMPPVISGTDAGDFTIPSDDCASRPIFGPDLCSIDIQFAPSALGARTATLTIDDGNGSLDVTLDGRGTVGTLTAAGVTFTPQPYFYGTNQQGGQIENQTTTPVDTTSYAISGPDAAHFSIAWGDGCFAQTVYAGNNCGFGVTFTPDQTQAGTYTATLTIENDGGGGPLVIPLSATATIGPQLQIASQVSFGDITTGQDATRVLTLTNDGSDPMQIQQLFVLTGTPDIWYMTDNTCPVGLLGQSGVPAGTSCTVTLHYKPQDAGHDSAVFFVIGATPTEPVASVGLSGTGVAPIASPSAATPLPSALSATIVGAAAAGGSLSCQTNGSAGSPVTMTWLRNGAVVAGATGSTFALSNADVGASFTCTASSATGSASSTPSAPVRPRDLAALPGSFVDSGVARRVVGAHRLRLGHSTIRLSGGAPATAWAPYVVRAPVRVSVRLDGRLLGSGRTVVLSPRKLARVADGDHNLSISTAKAHISTRILLLDATLAVHTTGGPDRTTTISLSGRAGIGSTRFTTGAHLNIKAPKNRLLGRISYTSANSPQRIFELVGPRTTTDGVGVRLRLHSIQISGLPAETGVVTVSLRGGTVSGHGATIRAATTLRGDGTPTTTVGPLTWHR